MADDICGSTDTTTGKPCQNDAGSCPHHGNKGGAPSKFNEERRERILEAARAGTTVEGCARAAGIHYRTLRRWLDRGEDETGTAYAEFDEQFSTARSEAERDLVEAVSNEDPKFILERSYDYTKSQEIEHSHNDAVPIDAGSEVLRITEDDVDHGDDTDE